MNNQKEIRKEVRLNVRVENHIAKFIEEQAKKNNNNRSLVIREILFKAAQQNELQPTN